MDVGHGISTLDVRSGVDTTISGNISGTDGTSALTKISPGKLTLAGTNTYTGGTTISAGTLQLGSGGNNRQTLHHRRDYEQHQLNI